MKLFNEKVTSVVIGENTYKSENGFIDFKDKDVEFAKNVLKFTSSPALPAPEVKTQEMVDGQVEGNPEVAEEVPAQKKNRKKAE